MTPERWQQLRALFEAAMEQPVGERPQWVAHACRGDLQLAREVGDLLRADGVADGGLTLAPEVASPTLALEGRPIGPYAIVREIGRGGMGVVYLAQRADRVYSKHVALKIIGSGRPGPELLHRFLQEREIVAKLDHPNIARLLDGGTTDEGLPYSVIEYVDGQPIDIYCDSRSLTVTERLALLRTVCDAVQYAHRHLIVHRDLKPSNILVTPDGIVKLLDFGIAKNLEPTAQNVSTADFGQRLFTAAYASPEQVRGERITTSADLYSLGVIAYELLTGRQPYRTAGLAMHEQISAVLDRTPVVPSEAVVADVDESAVARPDGHGQTHPSAVREGTPLRLRRRLAGDLDTILMMALRKESDRRYESVERFSDDVARHLDGLPVLARPDTVGYRARKFVGRHRLGVVAAAMVLLSMTAAIAGTSWQARIARDERRNAEERAAEARVQADRAERQTREAEQYRRRADSEAEFARTQLRLVEERTREADAQRTEAASERARAERRARDVLSVTEALLTMNANLPAVPGGIEAGRRAVDVAERSLEALRLEGFTDATLSGGIATAQEAARQYDRLRANVTSTTPPGWRFAADNRDSYEHGLDATVAVAGAAAYLKSRRPDGDGFALLQQSIKPGPYLGKRVRVSASLRSTAIEGTGGLFFVTGADGEVTNLLGLPLRGTNDWARHAVVFDVGVDAAELRVGFALRGSGAIWADDFAIEVVDEKTPLTRTLPSGPVNLEFAVPRRTPVR
jgi:serine/threonine protein kinase